MHINRMNIKQWCQTKIKVKTLHNTTRVPKLQPGKLPGDYTRLKMTSVYLEYDCFFVSCFNLIYSALPTLYCKCLHYKVLLDAETKVSVTKR